MAERQLYPAALAASMLLALPASTVQAAPLTPASGALTVTGNMEGIGSFEIQATLQGGNFNGNAKFDIDGQTLRAALLPNRNYLENGKCYFRIDSGRARAELGGPCDSNSFRGRFESFIPGQGTRGGDFKGQVVLAAKPAAGAKAGSTLPSGKLTCAYNEAIRSFKLGETTQYQLRFSNMVSLTLAADGTYRAGTKSSGSFVREGSLIRLTSGTWSGAVGTLEPDRSGQPAVVFYIDQNRRPDGVHIVDPFTTRCTSPR